MCGWFDDDEYQNSIHSY